MEAGAKPDPRNSGRAGGNPARSGKVFTRDADLIGARELLQRMPLRKLTSQIPVLMHHGFPLFDADPLEGGGAIVRPDLAELMMAGLERENAIWRRMRELEPWESRLRREVWRRSFRGRWAMSTKRRALASYLRHLALAIVGRCDREPADYD